MIISFTSPEANLETAGGKGANLARLSRGGFNVPPGFIISTSAYCDFVKENALEAVIQTALDNLSSQTCGLSDDINKLEDISARIRTAFSMGKVSDDLTRSVQIAYANLNQSLGIVAQVPVAIRSSATAEDLPDMSFAGQQDTFLNVVGDAQIMASVVRCWSSLWTARAIGYRIRNKIFHDDAALAVIVQVMVMSDVSGVLFTVNPLTGLLSESVIDATFGLGEALVSGQVEPDHFVVDSLSGVIKNTTIGKKEMSTRARAGGGVVTVSEHIYPTGSLAGRQTLSDNEIRQLVAAGQSIQNEFELPQDIEWAFMAGELFILQSRAVTSLFPLPAISFDPIIVWFSFGAVQGLLGPMTPLGRDAIQYLVAGAGQMFQSTPYSIPVEELGLGMKGYSQENIGMMQQENASVIVSAGERLWIKISDVVHHPIGIRIVNGLLGFIEPSVGQIILSLKTDPRLGAGKGRLKFSTIQGLAYFALPVLARLARNMLRPEQARARFNKAIEEYLSTEVIAPAPNRFGRLKNVIIFMKDRIASAFAFLLPKFIPILGPSMAALNFLNHISPIDALEVTRGLPDNVTTEMDLALWQTAKAIRADEPSAALFNHKQAAELVSLYRNGLLPLVAQSAVANFMERYGMRGIGEIDFGQPRWREEPVSVLVTLQSYLKIDFELAPDVLFAKGEVAARNAIENLSVQVRNQPVGWLKEKLVRAAARRIRLLMGARESPKFFAIRNMGIARKAMLEVGREFVEAGTIEQADDLVFLRMFELELLANSGTDAALAVDWKPLIIERRAAYERELRRKQVPRVLVSDGRSYYEGLGAATDSGSIISGSPVSPGVVVGIVHVIIDPRSAQLAPGEILVCSGTDPAWTPLFMTAVGLITEVGGMMTHGSVVAREYGIPAVVGVHQATTRLKDGQRIRLDGTTGKIAII